MPRWLVILLALVCGAALGCTTRPEEQPAPAYANPVDWVSRDHDMVPSAPYGRSLNRSNLPIELRECQRPVVKVLAGQLRRRPHLLRGRQGHRVNEGEATLLQGASPFLLDPGGV